MAQPQVKPRRTSPQIIEGTPQEIATHLKKFSAEERLTLIAPGKALETNGTAASGSKPEMSFDDVFGPLQQGFEESGITEEELGELIDAEIKASRAERRAQEQSSDE